MARRTQRGFTLVEIMVVVAILGVLAAIAIPAYRGYVSTARMAEAKSNLETIRLLQEQFYADRRQYVEGADTAALVLALPGFEPGDPAKLNYQYSAAFTGGNDQTFVATATPIGGAPPNPNHVSGNFTIDQSNNRNW